MHRMHIQEITAHHSKVTASHGHAGCRFGEKVGAFWAGAMPKVHGGQWFEDFIHVQTYISGLIWFNQDYHWILITIQSWNLREPSSRRGWQAGFRALINWVTRKIDKDRSYGRFVEAPCVWITAVELQGTIKVPFWGVATITNLHQGILGSKPQHTTTQRQINGWLAHFHLKPACVNMWLKLPPDEFGLQFRSCWIKRLPDMVGIGANSDAFPKHVPCSR